jgi:hypothetical protein
MHQIKDKIYKIKENQRLKHVMKQIPNRVILFKVLTGIGATTLEIESLRNSIIIEPNVPVIMGKCGDYNKGNKILLRGVYEKISVDDVVTYLESNVQHKKIIVTPESFFKVKEAMRELGIDMYDTYMLVIDECERTIQDVGFRASIILPMNDFFKFKNKAFISATPILPSDPRFKQQGFGYIYLKPSFKNEQKIKLIETNNVLLSLKQFIVQNPRKQYFIFFNSTDTIAHFVNELEVKDTSGIFCSKESMQKLKVNDFVHVKTILGEFRLYNWFTSRFFSAVDIKGVVDPTIIIISDLVSALHSTVDPMSEAIQIIGRFRKPEDGKIKREVVHITNFLPELTSQTEEEVIQYIKECQAVYRILKRFMEASTTKGAVSTLKEILQRIEFAKYINKDGSRNYFMQDNTVYEERIKGYYQSFKNLIAAYEASGHFIIDTDTEKYGIPDKSRSLNQNSTPLKTVYSVIMPMIRDLHDPNITTPFQRGFQMDYLRQEFKAVVKDFDRLGYEAVAELNFDPKRIKAAIAEKTKKEQSSNFGLMQSVDTHFFKGELCSSQMISFRLRIGIKENKLTGLTPNVQLLRNYCKLSKRIWIGTDKGGKNLMGYRIEEIYNSIKS